MLMGQWIYWIFSFIIFINFVGAFQFLHRHGPTPTPYHDWDYIMFSQRWPITACSEWKESGSSRTCNLPPNKDEWIIHGIWPTKTGTEGPLFCPSSIHFDPTQLGPIMDGLKAQWTNIESGTKPNSFWKHEWDKHGTCASVSPLMNSVTNYFTRGLEWNKQFKLTEILSKSNIIPGKSGYTPQQISDAIKASVKTNPIIQCATDKVTKESMINEIRLCFNKTMELVDCDHTNAVDTSQSGSLISNCNMKKEVMYYAEVPTRDMSYELDYIGDDFRKHLDNQMYYLRLYKVLKFLIWFTT